MATVKRDNPKAFAALNARLKELESKTVKAGWFENARYESGTPVAYVAAIQEFGVSKRSLPPRPFMRPAATDNRPQWQALAESGAKAILAGRETAASVMDQIGQRASGDIAKSIARVFSPPLSPITILLRRWRRDGRVITGRTVGEAAAEVKKPGYQPPAVSTKPLVDSAVMINSVTSVVEDDAP